MASPCSGHWNSSTGKLVAVSLLLLVASGCSNPLKTVTKIGIKLVGDATHEIDTERYAKQLLGQPADRADATLGPAIERFSDIHGPREAAVYRVEHDLLDKFRWVVEFQRDEIVALSKVQFDPGGGKDIIKKTLLRELLIGKTPSEVEDRRRFGTPELVLRSRSSGNLVRVYDVSKVTDLLGSRYCVLRFDRYERCEDIRLVGVPATRATQSNPGRRPP